MHLSGSKVIAILCITTAISSAIEVLTEVQKRNFTNNSYNNNKRPSYELNILNEFLNYNQLHRAIIIYTSTTSISQITTQRWQDNAIKEKYMQLPLVRKLSENNYLRFINTLRPNSTEYLFRSFIPRQGVFMKYKSNDKEQEMILNLVSMREKFNKSLKWLLLMEGIKNPSIDIQRELGPLNIRIDADVTVAIYREEFIFDLYDVYKICHKCGSPLEILYKGNWTTKEGFTILNKFQYGIAIRRNNFKMCPVKAATLVVNKSPTLNITDLEYFNNDKDFLDEDAMQRKTYQLFKLMEDLFNFTFDMHFSKTWGDKINNTWTGVIGLLYSQQTDLALSPLRYLLPRIAAVDFSRNVHYEKIYFLFRHPKHSSIRNIFFEPLADVVWWCTLALIVLTILLLAIHMWAEYKILTMLQKQKQVNGSITTSTDTLQQRVENKFDFIVLCIFETILQQGPALELFRCNSTRLFVLSLSVFSILLMQFYGAFIVSSLLSEAPRTITNLQSLYDSSLELGMENVSYNYDIFMNNKNPMVRNLYKYRICNKQTNRPNVMTLEEGVKKIGKGNFAFHAGIDRAYRLLSSFLTESKICDLQEINVLESLTFTLGIAMRKSTPYYEFTTMAIAKFQEASLMANNNKKWEVYKIDCTALQSKVASVDIEHFAPALGFLIFSILISFSVLICEIIYKHVTIRFKIGNCK